MSNKYDNIKRAGVIPFTRLENGKVVYLFGIDTPSKEITDWGGQVEKEDLDIFHTAARELSEESLGCVKLSPEQISKGKLMNDGNILISMVELNKADLVNSIVCFNKEYEKLRTYRSKNLEVCGTLLLNSKEVNKCISEGKFYSKVAKLLENNKKIL